MSVHLSVGFSAHPCGAFLIVWKRSFHTIIKPGAKFPVKHRAFLYVILSEPPKKTSTEFYIIRKISELTFLYFKQKRYDFVRLYGHLNRTVFFKIALRTLS